MATRRQFRAIVKGRVQGVYFRATTVEEALALGLAGFARNLPDGSVEVVARGDAASLEKLIAFLRVGPRIAQVASVDIDWSDTTPAPDPFTVVR
ncbi:MAG: acylphosphatase [Candidatus Eisenbacteria bacterium]|nr:acylphosphatase [Candidatus Eisenbacteria bacterium]